jgi:hypothetical protein
MKNEGSALWVSEPGVVALPFGAWHATAHHAEVNIDTAAEFPLNGSHSARLSVLSRAS